MDAVILFTLSELKLISLFYKKHIYKRNNPLDFLNHLR
jgi:hypothetical protein